METIQIARSQEATVADTAYRVVRELILTGAIAPGEFIRERTTAARLQLSRTPIREACGRLASEGFLERVPNRGFRAPRQPIRDLLDLYPIVTALELLAAEESLPRASAKDLAALRRHDHAMQCAAGAGDAAAAIQANEEFHARLTVHCSNGRLMRMLDELRHQVMGLELWSASVDHLNVEAFAHHGQILEAVEHGDIATALQVLRVNRMQTHTALKRGMTGQEEVTRPRR
jgi:DNA-binding GntR family transcriptional regulator